MLYGYGMGFAGLFGLLVGSFLNVVVYRVPLGQSVVSPRSRCPSCSVQVAARDNVPVLSWLILRGRCRHCRSPISPRYPAVEGATGLLALGVWWRVVPRGDVLHLGPLRASDATLVLPVLPDGPSLVAAGVYFAFLASLLAVSLIDVDHRIIPNRISLPGMALGLLATAVLSLMGRAETSVVQSSLGILCGYGFLFAVSRLGALLYRKEAMGMGDAKLLGMMGAFLGAWPALPFIMMVGAMTASVVGIAVAVKGRTRLRETYLPFGPFLCLGAAAWFFAGVDLVSLWMRWITSLTS